MSVNAGFAFALLLAACAGVDGEDTWELDIFDNDVSTTAPVTSAACRWTDDGFQLEITNGDPDGYELGLAETGDAPDPWTGEDCYLGYVMKDGSTLQYCHPVEPDGVSLAPVESTDALVAGSTTLLAGTEGITYLLIEAATGYCWIWGDDLDYYAALRCDEPALSCTRD